MNGDYRNSVILAAIGFVIMLCASFGVMKIMPLTVACSIVMAIGLILVVLALVNIYYPNLLRGKQEEKPAEEPKTEEEMSEETFYEFPDEKKE